MSLFFPSHAFHFEGLTKFTCRSFNFHGLNFWSHFLAVPSDSDSFHVPWLCDLKLLRPWMVIRGVGSFPSSSANTRWAFAADYHRHDLDLDLDFGRWPRVTPDRERDETLHAPLFAVAVRSSVLPRSGQVPVPNLQDPCSPGHARSERVHREEHSPFFVHLPGHASVKTQQLGSSHRELRSTDATDNATVVSSRLDGAVILGTLPRSGTTVRPPNALSGWNRVSTS